MNAPLPLQCFAYCLKFTKLYLVVFELDRRPAQAYSGRHLVSMASQSSDRVCEGILAQLTTKLDQYPSRRSSIS